MTNKPQHTAIPWEPTGNGEPVKNIKDPIFYKLGIKHGGIRVAEAHGIGEEEAKANAAFIVKAVNSHDELVEALKSVLDTIESYNQVKNVFNLNSAQWKKAKQALKNAE